MTILNCRKYCEQTHKGFEQVTHCIFDMDGTLVDSEIMYHEVIGEICKENGKVYTKEMMDRMCGRGDHDVCSFIVKELQLDMTPDQFEDRLREMCDVMLPLAPLQKGAGRLLYHLKDYDIPIALATNSTNHAVQLHAKNKPDIFGLFNFKDLMRINTLQWSQATSACDGKVQPCRNVKHRKVTISDPEVHHGKPAPDMYLIAAERFPCNPPPIKCLVFEDSAIGLKAAVAAGMQVIFIPTGDVDSDAVNSATLVLNNLLEFKPQLFGLPPF